MRRRQLTLAVAAALAVAIGNLPASGYARPFTRAIVDRLPNGDLPAAALAGTTALSHDGRYLALETDAALTSSDTNGAADIYLRDQRTGRVTLVSHGIAGTPGTGVTTCLFCYGAPERFLPGSITTNPVKGAWDPSISAAGRFVAFTSSDTNLVAGDTNAITDVFVYDVLKRVMTRASVASQGAQANGHSWLPSISANGRYVSFTSEATNLVPGDTNVYPDVFVHDLRTGATKRVSVSSSGGQVCGYLTCSLPVGGDAVSTLGLLPIGGVYPQSSISGDGRYVEFSNTACGLTPNNQNCGHHGDVYVRDTVRGTTTLISVAPDGSTATFLPSLNGDPYANGSSLSGSSSTYLFATSQTISDDGRYAVFVSSAQNLVPAPPLWKPTDVEPGLAMYVRDLRTNRTNRVDVQSNGEGAVDHANNGEFEADPSSPAISGNGRFIAMECTRCESLQPMSTLAVYDQVTGQLLPIVSPASHARDAKSLWNGDWHPALSGDGRWAAFSTFWTPTGPTQPNWSGASDLFGYDRGPTLGVAEIAAGSRLDVGGSQPLAAALPLGSTVTGASLVYRPAERDLFLRMDLPTGTSESIFATAATYGLELTVPGARYEVRASTLPTQTIQLLRLDPVLGWHVVGQLHGSIGVIGAQIAVAIPLSALGIDGTATLTDLHTFAGLRQL